MCDHGRECWDAVVGCVLAVSEGAFMAVVVLSKS